MTALLLTMPAVEPVSLSEAKAWLRVDHDTEDTLVSALVTSARLAIEADTRTLLITQDWQLVMDKWCQLPCFTLSLAPVQSIIEIRVYDTEGTARIISPQTYILDRHTHHPRIHFSVSPPNPGKAITDIELDLRAGFGSTPADVPQPIKQAILFLVARWYENRGDVAQDTRHIPSAAEKLIAPWRKVQLT